MRLREEDPRTNSDNPLRRIGDTGAVYTPFFFRACRSGLDGVGKLHQIAKKNNAGPVAMGTLRRTHHLYGDQSTYFWFKALGGGTRSSDEQAEGHSPGGLPIFLETSPDEFTNVVLISDFVAKYPMILHNRNGP